MKVTVKNLTTNAKFEADIVEGSIDNGKVDLGDGRIFVGGHGNNWLDSMSDQGFRYEITEVVNPTALMKLIGNIPAGEWSKISAMANEEIKNTFTGLPPVNKAQVIRCLYAFERYARENGLI